MEEEIKDNLTFSESSGMTSARSKQTFFVKVKRLRLTCLLITSLLVKRLIYFESLI